MTEQSAPASSGASTTAPTPVRRASTRRTVLLFVRDVVIIVVAALLISFLIKTFLIRTFYIPSASMQSTLQVNDRIIVNQLVPQITPIQRGDIVVFRDPGGWLPTQPEQPRPPLDAAGDWVLSLIGLSASDSDEHLVKRVIGLPGDRVVCCNDLGQLSINGVPIDERYVRLPADTTNVSSRDFQEDVPDGTLWVMGDNRYDSADSRIHGVVPIDDVVGRAFVISWPVDRWRWLDTPPITFDGVEQVE